MKTAALAFLISAVVPACWAAAQNATTTDTGAGTTSTDQQKSPAAPASPTPFKYGVQPGVTPTADQQKTLDQRKGKVMDGSGQLTDASRALKSLSAADQATANAAMQHGLTPVIVNGQIMGYDDPINQICLLPDAVKGLTPAAPTNPTSGTTPADNSNETVPGMVNNSRPTTPGTQATGGNPPNAPAKRTPAANPDPSGLIAMGIKNNDQSAIENGLSKEDQQTNTNMDGNGGGFHMMSEPAANAGPHNTGTEPPMTTDSVNGGGNMGDGPSGQISQGPGGMPGGHQITGYVKERAQNLMDYFNGLKRAPLAPPPPDAHYVVDTPAILHNSPAFQAARRIANEGDSGTAALAGALSPTGERLEDQGSTDAGRSFDGNHDVRNAIPTTKCKGTFDIAVVCPAQ